jgi:two-component system, chemotaxis family, sensor histidine kinase and response regulator WspE
MSDYDDMSMNDIFGLDSAERIKALNQIVLELEKSSENAKLFDNAMREAHTLKGAARIVGCKDTQTLAHKMEEIFEALKDKSLTLNTPCIDLLLKTLDAVSETSTAFVKEVTHSVNVELIVQKLEKAKKGEFDLEEEVLLKSEDSPKEIVPLEEPEESSEVEDSMIRVGVDKLETMMNLAGEIYTNTLYLEGENQKTGILLGSLAQVALSIESVSTLLDSGRGSLEKAEDGIRRSKTILGNFQKEFSKFVQAVNNVSLNLSHLGVELQDEVMLSRMVPIATLFDVYVRVVRDFSRDFGKKIRLKIEGERTQVDKRILEVLKDPLMHLMRNACDHGIELPEMRKEARKEEEGEISLTASYKEDRLFIIVEDNGAGVNYERLKDKAIERNLVTKEKADQLSDKELLEFIYLPGFSTAKSVTEVSGRGVGLDVVKSNLATVGGTISLESEEGEFSRFTLSLPLTLAVTKCVLVKSGGETIGFPLVRIEEVCEISQDAIKIVEGKEAVDIQGEIISLIHLSSLWGLPKQTASSNKKYLIIIGQAEDKVALSVDSFLGEKDIVNKPLDKRLKNLPDISGGTILGDGRIAYVVSVDSLIRSASEYLGGAATLQEVELESEVLQVRAKKILVVEDSLTVRELEKKVLQNNGYEVVAAVDGQDGWNKVKDGNFDLVVTDIEMPRMDGFELISRIKKDEKLRNIPTIIVTFREAEEDKRRGVEVGADKYIVKSQYDDKVLLETIEILIGHG